MSRPPAAPSESFVHVFLETVKLTWARSEMRREDGRQAHRVPRRGNAVRRSEGAADAGAAR